MSNVKNYTDKQLLDRVKLMINYKEIPTNYWILGVRSNEDQANVFDDKFYIFKGTTFHSVLTGTTNPGTTILRNFYKYNSKGAAILASDRWYYNVWNYGLHRGKMPALLQTGAPVLVYRDGDKDDKSEELGKPEAGFFGINFHLNSYNLGNKLVVSQIGAWSAGCQVPNQAEKYTPLIELFKKENKSVSYCLINEF
jgi:hypothetical protein